MEHSKTAKVLGAAALLCAALLTALRLIVLKTAFDENGLLPPGSPALIITVLACAACFAALWLLSLRLNRLPGTEDCFTQRSFFLGWSLIAAVLVFFGGFLLLLDGRITLDLTGRIAAFSAMASALAMVWTALAVDRGRPLFWPRLVTALYVGAALILRFREWSHDPMTIHIIPLLLAWTCCMVETMLLTGFPLKADHRRSAVLFGLAALGFGCMALPDYIIGQQTSLSELLTLLGLVLWCAEAAFALLRKRTQEEPPEPEEERKAEDETSNPA